MVDAEAKLKAAEIAEKYTEVLRPMADKALVDELERQALMASFGYQAPSTAAMLKAAKAEILRRLKGESGPAKEADPEPGKDGEKKPTAPQRQSLFD